MDNFYADLPSFTDFEDVATPDKYTPVPDGWFVVITDVRGSTKAIEAGRYKEVNVLGASSIVAALNAVNSVAIAYVFGGDGATILVPESVREAVVQALVGLARRAEAAYGLGLRVGVVPVGDLTAKGHRVLIAKYSSSPNVSLAMFTGGGLAVADEWVKDEVLGQKYAALPSETTPEPDLTGLQCRWNPIKSRNGNMLSVLAVALAEDDQSKADTYKTLLRKLEQIAERADLKPVSAQITLADSASKLEAEAKIQTGQADGLKVNLYKAKAYAKSKVAGQLMARGASIGNFDGTTYRDEVVQNTDFRKFDDCLRMVLDATPEVETELRKVLEEGHKAGDLAFGIHVSDSALMTCMVFEFDQNHVHFVDGGDGGYALAAKSLKAQLKQAKEP